MLIVMIAFTASGLLAAGLAIPLLRGKVPPNRFYGFRTPATLRDEELWYAANQASARHLLVWGICCTVIALGAFFLPNISEEVYFALNLGAVVGGGLVVILWSFGICAGFNRSKAKRGQSASGS